MLEAEPESPPASSQLDSHDHGCAAGRHAAGRSAHLPPGGLELHRAFKLRIVASLAHDGWTLTDEDVAEAILHLG